MNIVIISEYETRELYVIEQVVDWYPETVVLRPTYPSNKEGWGVPGSNGKSVPEKLADAVTWKLHRSLWNRKFYPRNDFPDIPNIIGIPSTELHTPEGIKTVNSFSPDIIITCRAPILKPELFETADIAAVNIHYGIAPRYRGNDSLFWALNNNDFEYLGGCIHHLDAGIDTGNILAEVYPALSPFDGEVSVDYKTSLLLAEVLLKFLKTAELGAGDLTGKPQKKEGQIYNSSDRSLKKSVSYILKRAAGFSKPPRRAEKIVTYF